MFIKQISARRVRALSLFQMTRSDALHTTNRFLFSAAVLGWRNKFQQHWFQSLCIHKWNYLHGQIQLWANMEFFFFLFGWSKVLYVLLKSRLKTDFTASNEVVFSLSVCLTNYSHAWFISQCTVCVAAVKERLKYKLYAYTNQTCYL